MPLRQRILAGLLIVAVVLLAVFAMSIVLLRLRPLDPEGLRAPVITSSFTVKERAA
jgi:cation transporter-like permease